MGALGFTTGVGVSAIAWTLEGDAHSRMVIAIIVVVIVCMLSMMCFAVAKIALVQRLEYLQKEIKKLEQGSRPSPAP